MFTRKLAAAGVIAALMLGVAPVFAEDTAGTATVSGTVSGSSTEASSISGKMHERDGENQHHDKNEGMQKPLDPICLGTAFDKRDGAISAAFDVFVAAFKSAVSARATALKAAWALTDASLQEKAVHDARAAFRSATKMAQKALRMVRKGASQQFKTDRKACGGRGDIGDEGDDGLKL